jgi:hypothetical protein
MSAGVGSMPTFAIPRACNMRQNRPSPQPTSSAVRKPRSVTRASIGASSTN